MEKIKTIFFGTHTFAVTILKALHADPNIAVVSIVTQKDKPVGRKKILTPPPAKVWAQENDIPVVQLQTLKKADTSLFNCDLGITAQYGLLIPQAVLDTPTHGILNVHTSLLPKYRGASPIQSALLHGETQTGVTIMKMDAGLDTGPILLQKTLEIEKDDTYPILDEKLAKIGAQALLESISPYVSGQLQPKEQDHTAATTCSQLSREDGKVDWNKDAQTIYNQYRGLTPWPGIWTRWNDKRLKLLSIATSDKQGSPGAVVVADDGVYVGTANGSIILKEIQLEGKSKTDAVSFVAGHENFAHATLT